MIKNKKGGKQRKVVWRALENRTPRGFNQNQFQRNSLLYLIILTCLLWRPPHLTFPFYYARCSQNNAVITRTMSAWLSLVSDTATPRLKKWDSWRFIYEETLKFVNKTKYCKTLNMLSNKIKILGIICTKCLRMDDNFYFY